jgi:hypothetical protein
VGLLELALLISLVVGAVMVVNESLTKKRMVPVAIRLFVLHSLTVTRSP